MKAHADLVCKLCDGKIKEDSNYEEFAIHGKYHDICSVCYNQIYYKVVNIIIKKIK